MTAQDVYASTISALPASEQFQLAKLILEGLSDSAVALDYRDHWSDEDLQDVTRFSVEHASNTVGDE